MSDMFEWMERRDADCPHHVHDPHLVAMALERVEALLYRCDGCGQRELVPGWKPAREVDGLVAEAFADEPVPWEDLDEPCHACVDRELDLADEEEREWRADQRRPDY